ncbi:MAG: trigger factor [Bacteroidota bacterium]|jgi:trigger factor
MSVINNENIGLLHQKVTITIAKNEYMPKVEESLKKMAKTATVKGFRQGMVPSGVIKKMHGRELLSDALSKNASAKIDAYIRENSIKFLGHPLSMPMTQELDINQPTDYQFVFELGIQPEFTITMPNGTDEITELKIPITDDIIDKEVSYEQTRHGKSVETDTMGNDDVISVEVKGAEFEKSIHLLVTTIKDEAIKKSILNLKVDESMSIDFNAAYNNDTEFIIHKVLNVSHEEFTKIDVTAMTITLKKIFRLNKAELNEEFYNIVFPGKGITTLDAFKSAIKEELEKVYERETARKTNTDVRDFLVKNTKMEFPIQFLRKWLKSVNKEPLTDEALNEGFESFIADLKWTLIKNKMIIENSLQVNEADVKAKVMEYLREAYKGMEDAMLEGISERILGNEKEAEYMIQQIIDERVFGHLRKNILLTPKEVSIEEYDQLMNPHHHGHHHH